MGWGDPPVAFEVIRILSDLHYGDRSSRVRSLAALRPLFAGADRVVFNGDSLETRAGRSANRTEQHRQRFLDFVHHEVPRGVLLTGNHDADISDLHHLDLLGGIVFVTHGEILFEDLVPWSAEQPQIGELYRQELAALLAGRTRTVGGAPPRRETRLCAAAAVARGATRQPLAAHRAAGAQILAATAHLRHDPRLA